GVSGRPLRHRPGLQYPVRLQPEVVVQRARTVLLHHERRPPARQAPASRGLAAAAQVPLAAVCAQRVVLAHLCWFLLSRPRQSWNTPTQDEPPAPPPSQAMAGDRERCCWHGPSSPSGVLEQLPAPAGKRPVV